jgi:hypothetical protein
MKTTVIELVLGCMGFVWTCNLHAQYTLDWSKFSGGGAVSGGGYTLDGTVGQSDAGNLSGGGYALDGGFWAGAISAPTLFITGAGAEAVLSWTGSGFVVQSSEEAKGSWVDVSPGITTDGLQYRVHTSVAGRKRFFQLRAGQCIDFQTMSPMSVTPPWSFLGVTFQTFDVNGAASSPTIQARTGAAGSATGLNCDHKMIIDLPASCSSVTLVLASSAHPATVTAYDVNGSVTAMATTVLAGQLAPETLQLAGSGIKQIVIEAPAQETLLLQICCGP